VRIALLVPALLFPSQLAREYLFTSDSGLEGMADAVVRLELRSFRPLEGNELARGLHDAVLIGVFKADGRLPETGGAMPVIEPRGFMLTEDGYQPPWDTSKQLPPGTEATVFLVWDSDFGAFRMWHALNVRLVGRDCDRYRCRPPFH
jgi:hypothetical protein